MLIENVKKTGAVLLSCWALFGGTSFAGTDMGNGGAGVIRNGHPMTFYTARIFVNRAEDETTLPELRTVMDRVSGIEVLSTDSRMALYKALNPSESRRYFRVDKGYFDDITQQRLKAEYSRVMAGSPSDLTLFAVTDTITKTTFLLPQFFDLSEVEKQAILFHEAYWILFPKASYDRVVNAEISFQELMENPANARSSLRFVKNSFFSSVDLIRAAALVDKTDGTLGDLFVNGSLRLSVLFGHAYFSCVSNTVSRDCHGVLEAGLIALSNKYGRSELLKALIGYFQGLEKDLIGNNRFDDWIASSIHWDRRRKLNQGYLAIFGDDNKIAIRIDGESDDSFEIRD